jgi:hypothetical protein
VYGVPFSSIGANDCLIEFAIASDDDLLKKYPATMPTINPSTTSAAYFRNPEYLFQ